MRRNELKFLKLFVLFLFIPVSALAQEERKVAVFDPVGSVDKALLEIVREEISSVVVNTTGFTVLERQLINKVLEENRFQESGLVNDEQVSDIGKRMGADYVFVTAISRLGTNYYISCKMIEVATARIDKQFTGTTTDGINDIPQTTQYIVKRLFGENVQQQVDNRPRQQTNQSVQAAVPHRELAPTSLQSSRPDVSSYRRLTTNGKNVFASGKVLHHAEIRTLMANSDALRYYNTGVRKSNNGKILLSSGFTALGIGAILTYALAYVEYSPDGYVYRFLAYEYMVVGGLVGLGCTIPGFALKRAGKRNILTAVEVFNRDGYGYTDPPPLLKIDFGITSSGGIGLAMTF